MSQTSQLVLLRHGQSQWNKENIFTGWVDIPLSELGLTEAINAGKQLRQINFSKIFVSKLMRAQMTACLAMQENSHEKIPYLVHQDNEFSQRFEFNHSQDNKSGTIPMIEAWQLNERFYGDLQGQNKDDMRAKYGPEKVKLWRRSFDISPPNGESLKTTIERTVPFFNDSINPCIEQGQNILVSAHGNSLRSIVMHLENMTQDQILSFEIPTGQPLVYHLSNGSYQRIEL